MWNSVFPVISTEFHHYILSYYMFFELVWGHALVKLSREYIRLIVSLISNVFNIAKSRYLTDTAGALFWKFLDNFCMYCQKFLEIDRKASFTNKLPIMTTLKKARTGTGIGFCTLYSAERAFMLLKNNFRSNKNEHNYHQHIIARLVMHSIHTLFSPKHNFNSIEIYHGI